MVCQSGNFERAPSIGNLPVHAIGNCVARIRVQSVAFILAQQKKIMTCQSGHVGFARDKRASSVRPCGIWIRCLPREFPPKQNLRLPLYIRFNYRTGRDIQNRFISSLLIFSLAITSERKVITRFLPGSEARHSTDNLIGQKCCWSICFPRFRRRRDFYASIRPLCKMVRINIVVETLARIARVRDAR